MTDEKPANTNSTNDIDALFAHLRADRYGEICRGNPNPDRLLDALDALVAERNALAKRVEKLESIIKEVVA